MGFWISCSNSKFLLKGYVNDDGCQPHSGIHHIPTVDTQCSLNNTFITTSILWRLCLQIVTNVHKAATSRHKNDPNIAIF